MNYWDNIDFLQRGLAAGAIPGDEALSSLMELDQARMEAKQARRQAQQEQLGSLLSTVQEAAVEGTPLSSLTRQYGKRALAPVAGPLDQLYSPGGYSTITPTLDAEDEGAISNMVYGMLANRTDGSNPDARTDLGTIRQQVMGRLAASLPHADLKHLIPAIDEVVTRSYSSAVRSPSSGYLDQLMTPTA